MPLEEIIGLQARWAKAQWPGHLGRRAPSLAENLIIPMSDGVRDQYLKGSGGELGVQGRPGKMSSLRSSSALTYNFFAPWIGHDLDPLATALEHKVRDGTMRFERKFRHGLRSMPPNMDLTLDNEQSRPLAIECKFTEPYGTKNAHPPIDQKYFSGARKRWTEVGLPRCQALAEALGQKVHFRRPGVGQLLKHLLGLARDTRQPPRLICLWFDSKCQEAREHRAELEQFSDYLDDAIDFRALSYQEVFGRIPAKSEPVPGYVEYLQLRYFAA